MTDEIKNCLLSEKDVAKLKAWNKIAGRVESIEEFWEKIQPK